MLEREGTAGARGPRGGPDHRQSAALALGGADEAVRAFWDHYARRREPSRASVEHLARLALARDEAEAVKGTTSLFRDVVEPLCDAFSRRGAATYRRVFAQVAAAARKRVRCGPFDAALFADGVRGEQDLLRRPEPPVDLSAPAERARVERVAVLSRLTLGADAAIGTVVLSRLEALFPNARIGLVGTAEAGVLAQAFERVDHWCVTYGRNESLADRLNAWPACRDAARAACGAGVQPGIVVDTDSRLTQLGLLRPVPGARYFRFPSRTFGAAGAEPLSVLANRWLDATFGEQADVTPSLRLARDADEWSDALGSAVRRGGDGPLVAVSFGVGGNSRKRAGADFEVALLERLVARGCRVLLARGTGDEVAHSLHTVRRLERRGVAVLNLPPGRGLDPLAAPRPRPDVVTWEGDVGAFLAAIACADAYVGYDSAGQHLAPALGVPTLSLFVESAGPRHGWRWSPRGRAPVRIVRARPGPHPERLLERTCLAFDALREQSAELAYGLQSVRHVSPRTDGG